MCSSRRWTACFCRTMHRPEASNIKRPDSQRVRSFFVSLSFSALVDPCRLSGSGQSHPCPDQGSAVTDAGFPRRPHRTSRLSPYCRRRLPFQGPSLPVRRQRQGSHSPAVAVRNPGRLLVSLWHPAALLAHGRLRLPGRPIPPPQRTHVFFFPKNPVFLPPCFWTRNSGLSPRPVPAQWLPDPDRSDR